MTEKMHRVFLLRQSCATIELPLTVANNQMRGCTSY